MSVTQDPLYTLPLPTTLGATSVTWVSPNSVESDILLAAGGVDRQTHVFSIPSLTPDISSSASPKELYTLHGHTAPVSSVISTGSGREVISASWDGNINLYTIPQDEPTSHQTPAEPISYLAQRDLKKRRKLGEDKEKEGERTIEGLTDGDVGSGGWRRLPDSTWRGHKGRVGALGYGGGGVVYSGGWDGSVRGWDVETGENIVIRVSQSDPSVVVFHSFPIPLRRYDLVTCLNVSNSSLSTLARSYTHPVFTEEGQRVVPDLRSAIRPLRWMIVVSGTC